MNRRILAGVAIKFLEERGLLGSYLKNNGIYINTREDFERRLCSHRGNPGFNFITVSISFAYPGFLSAHHEFVKQGPALYEQALAEYQKKILSAREDV